MMKQQKRKREGLRGKLQGLIVSGSLKPGSKLIELKLAKLMKVSRTPLREALLHLEREGLVRSDLRRGFTVEPLSARDVRETYPLLAQIECLAVRTSASLLPLVVPKLPLINERFRKARSPESARELDTLWHDTLMSQSKNQRLAMLVQGLRRTIERYECIYMADLSLVSISALQHDAIAAAFSEGELARGLELLEENYLFGMRALLRTMGEE